MAYRGARVGGAIADSASQFGQLLMQLIMRKDRQGQFDAASSQEQTRYDEGLKWRGERAKIEDADRIARTASEAEANRVRLIENNWQPLSNLTRPLSGDIGPLGIPGPGLDPRAASAPQTSVGGERMAYMPPERRPLVNLSRGGFSIQGVTPDDVPKYSSLLPPEVKPQVEGVDYLAGEGGRRFANTPEGQRGLLSWRGQHASAGRAPEPAPVTSGGIPGIQKLPVEAQAAATQYAPMYETLKRYEGMSRAYLDRGRIDRSMGAMGVPNEERDRALGELKATQQILIGQAKNVLKLGVLAGPDMDIVMGLIGDPTSSEALARNPEYTLSRFKQARQMIKDGVNTFQTTYGISIPMPPDEDEIAPPGVARPPEISAGRGRTSGAGLPTWRR